MNNHASKCVLQARCKVAGTVRCNSQCPHFIGLHGASGSGGRSAASGLPRDYKLVTLGSSPVAENQPKIYATLRQYAATFERMFDQMDGLYIEPTDRIKSLYLYSESPGTGKTTTAASLLNEWNIAHYIGSLKRSRQPLQRPSYFLDITEWQTTFNLAVMTNNESDMESFKSQMKVAMNVPFLVIDDVGVRECSPKFRGYIHAIINHRVSEQLVTVYTSNIPIVSKIQHKERNAAFKPYDLIDVFEERRLPDRIGDMTITLSFGGESKRGVRK